MQLLERSEIIARLEVLAEEAADGRGRVVSLVGEAGIGKSSVARTIAEHVRGRLRVFWGACEDLSTPAPLAPLYDFARLLDWRLPQADDFASRLSSFSAALSELSAAPTLAVIEDVHWADDATADFVRYIARRITGAPMLLMVTARNETVDAQQRLRRALGDVAVEDVERIELSRLSEAAVRDAANAHRRDGAAVFALTSGNPFLTMEVLRGSETVPSTVRDALLWRAEKLDQQARRALNAASIFPRRVERPLLREMCADLADTAIAECMAAGLLIAEGDFCGFKHEIARRAIEEALPQPERTRLNGQALRILRSVDPDAKARLAHHAVQASDVNAICELAPRAAAEASEAGAHREAYRHYASALAHADHFAEARRAELFEKASYELQLIGRPDEAIASLNAALSLRRGMGDTVKAGDALRWMARLHYFAGDRVSADRLGKQAIEVLRPTGPNYELAMAFADLALTTALRDESIAAIGLANTALQLANQLGLDEIVAYTHGTLGVAKQWLDSEAAHEHYSQGLKLALALNRPELVARLYNNGGNFQLNLRAHQRARTWLESGIRYCSDHDMLTWTTYMNGLLAELGVREGEWAAALELAERTLEGDLSPVMRFPASVALARLYVRTGKDVTALFASLTFDDEPQRRLDYAPILGEHAWITQGETEAALRVLRTAAPIAAAIGNTWAAGEIAYWRHKLGDVAPSDLEGLAEPYWQFFSGDWRAAADTWQALGVPYDAALALLEGDESACDDALCMFDSLGAKATGARARKALRERGMRGVRRGPRSATQQNKAGLTIREMDVLRLLEQGMSNAQIANRLNTAVKTIDHHVSSIMEKLRSASRGEAVARARQIGLIH
jgi:DNA-binding CsgD family transcriptional regulator/tetratricopeptide (TPR) repeat protein